MTWHRTRMLLLAGAVFTLVGMEAQAFGGRKTVCCDDPCAPVVDPCCPPPAPAFKTVRVCEMVPTTVPKTVTRYRTEYKTETVTAYRIEKTPETKQVNVTVLKPVTETVMKTVTRCVTVPVTETRTCTVTRCVPRTETVMVARTVDRGKYETRMVPAAPVASSSAYACVRSRGGRGLFGMLGRLCGRADACCEVVCCDPCAAPVCGGCGGCGGDLNGGAAAGGVANAAPAMVETQVWVPNLVTEQVPTTVTRMVEEQVPHTYTVTVCKVEHRTETIPVTVTKCVPVTECRTVTHIVCRSVPYTCTRTVPVCVPYTETCMVTKLVPVWTEKVVPCCEPAPCCPPRKGLLSRLRDGGRGLFNRCRKAECCDAAPVHTAPCCN